MSERLRRTTEARWEEDRYLSSAEGYAGGGECCRDGDHRYHGHGQPEFEHQGEELL